jgi:spore coat protein JB
MKNAELMKNVQMAQFSLIETVLYLDTHPFDADALASLEYYSEKLAIAIEEYEAECGPLFAENSDKLPFAWVKTPFPWELEC